MNKQLALLLLLIICVAQVEAKAKKENDVKKTPKTNVIFLVGDGMGVAYTSAYRYYQDDPATKIVETTIFDEMLMGMASTYPDDDKLTITDSAAAGTALAAGIKTFNGAIGVNKLHQPVKTVLDVAKENGYLTGIAVTSHVTDATPAAFVAHVDSRYDSEHIADQYLDLRVNGKPKMDLLLGGGRDYFVRKDRNLIDEFSALDYTYISDFEQLSTLKKLPVLGLFTPVGMTSALDSEHPLRLTEMTEKSLELLQDKPFFLMLEASQVDWCGHSNDIACAMAEMHDMAETMKVIKRFIDAHPNTIFVATADHSTGGLSIGANGVYQWNSNVIKNIKNTAAVIAKKLLADKTHWKDEWQKLTAIQLTAQEQVILENELKADKSTEKNEIFSKENNSKVYAVIISFINKYTNTGWTTNGHTGDDVQVFSYGKDKNNFSGAMDDTDIAKKLFNYLKAE